MENDHRKEEIRRQVLTLRDRMEPEERLTASFLLADRLIGHQWFYRAGKLLCFASFGSEIDTAEIITEAIRSHKKVYLPKVEGQDMEFYRIDSMEGLSAGYGGIREPDGSSERYVWDAQDREETLLIMPGVAFDTRRRRVGYGKGFYDRFLADKEGLRLRSIAIGFSCQMVAEVPEEEGDVRPYQVFVQ